MFEKLKVDLAPDVPGFRTPCPTRWTVKAATMESVIENYSVFQQLRGDAKDVATNSEVRSRITGVQFQMQSFDFLFGLLLGETIAEGQHVAELTCKTMDKIRNEESFDAFWKKALQYQSMKKNAI